MLGAAYRALAADDRLVIVVDDAHLLDPLSALLIQQLAVSGSPRFIVTIRSGEEVPDAVTALWKERLLLRLDIQPFTRPQAGQLIGSVLDGDVDNSVVDRLHQMAEGNPLFLRGLLTAALADGALVERDGCWRMNGRLRIDTELIDLVGTRLAALAPDELDVVESFPPQRSWTGTCCARSAIPMPLRGRSGGVPSNSSPTGQIRWSGRASRHR